MMLIIIALSAITVDVGRVRQQPPVHVCSLNLGAAKLAGCLLPPKEVLHLLA
jgi:hypothetical protein